MAKNENLDDTGSKREIQIKEPELGLWSGTRKLTIARGIEENNLNLWQAISKSVSTITVETFNKEVFLGLEQK